MIYGITNCEVSNLIINNYYSNADKTKKNINKYLYISEQNKI